MNKCIMLVCVRLCVYVQAWNSKGGKGRKEKRNRVTSSAVDYELPDELRGRLCLKDGIWGNRKQPVTMCEDSREENCRETVLRINMAWIAHSGS